jgi:hypothetical protein
MATLAHFKINISGPGQVREGGDCPWALEFHVKMF